jgi:hypothetical protein
MNVGENLWAIGPVSSMGDHAEDALKSWMCEGNNGAEYNHATQVLWRGTSRVGCASAYSGSYRCSIFVCTYRDPGNFVGAQDANVPRYGAYELGVC